MPRTYSAEETMDARAGVDSLGHFIIPVRVAKEGQTRLLCRFVCDEGSKVEKVVPLAVSKLTAS